MPANIAFNRQLEKYMFASTESAWHGLGQIVAEAMTWEQAMAQAGLNWEVEKRQLSFVEPEGSSRLVPAWGTFRLDTEQFLGAVGADYVPIQNKRVFDFMDALLEAEGSAHFEVAGVLGNGERVFVVAKVPFDFEVKGTEGDLHKTYLTGVTAHDGSMAKRLLLTDVRVVCENTLQMALSSDGKNALTVRHTQNAEAKLAEAKRLIKGSALTAKTLQEKLDILAEREMTRGSLLRIIDRLFKKEAQAEQEKEAELAISSRGEKLMTRVLELFEDNDANAFPKIRGTAYNLLNAFTNFTDHERSVVMTQARKDAGRQEKEVRMDTALFGSGSAYKNSVMEILLAETADNPTHDFSRAYSLPAKQEGESEKAAGLEQSLDELFPEEISL